MNLNLIKDYNNRKGVYMANSVNIRKALLISILLISVIIMVIVMASKKDSPDNDGDIEKMTIYNVSTNGATIQVFKSTPDDIVKSLKEYIKKNKYDGEDIQFIFCNGIYTNIIQPDSPMFDGNFNFNYDYSGNNQNFAYYIEEIYKDIFVGYMAMDVDGNIVETHNLITADELGKIKVEPDIGKNKAIMLSKEYLNLDTDTYILLEKGYKYLYRDEMNNVIVCYIIKFKDNENYVYVNGSTGEIIQSSLSR